MDGHKIRRRSPSFQDHYSRPALFWNSMADWEKQHIVEAFRFELGKVGARTARARTVEHLAKVDGELATQVARGIGVPEPTAGETAYKLSSPPSAWSRCAATAPSAPGRSRSWSPTGSTPIR